MKMEKEPEMETGEVFLWRKYPHLRSPNLRLYQYMLAVVLYNVGGIFEPGH